MSRFEFRYNITCYKDTSSEDGRWSYNISNKNGDIFGTNDKCLDIIPNAIHDILVRNEIENELGDMAEKDSGLFTAQIKFTVTYAVTRYTNSALYSHGFTRIDTNRDSPTYHEYIWECSAVSSEKCTDIVSNKLASMQADQGLLPIIFKALAADANVKLHLYGKRHTYCNDGMNVASILITLKPLDKETDK